MFQLVRRAYPYRNLERAEFDHVVEMLTQGFSTRRGRRGALIHHDTVNGRLRGRRGARMLAITSGGAIPDNADYRVILEPERTFIGTVNEDFAVESLQGDIFQLGNMSWRILRVQQGTVRVEDAHGQPPSIPFWLGEAPARSNELSAAVAELRGEVEKRLGDREKATQWVASVLSGLAEENGKILRYAQDDSLAGGSAHAAAHQLVEYLAESKRMLGTLPTQDTIVAERFFDEAGGHAARHPLPVREPGEPGLGPGAPEAVLPPVQLRAAGRRHRGRAAALARPAALVPAGHRLQVPPSRDGGRDPGPGAARRADVRHPLAVERHHRPGGPAEPGRA